MPQSCPKCNQRTAGTWRFCAYCGTSLEDYEPKKKRRRMRGNGEGCVYQGKNGKWVAQKACGSKTTPAGKRYNLYARKGGFATKKEALSALPSLNRAKTGRKQTGTSLEEVFQGWKAEYEKRGRAEKTLNGYVSAFAYYKELWPLYFAEIGIDDLQECIDSCPKGRRTRDLMKNVMSLIYKYAIPRRLGYDDTNLAAYLFCSGKPGAPKTRFTDAELEKLREAIGTVPFAEYVYADCYLGYRPSEFVNLDCAFYDYEEEYFKAGAKTEAGRDRAVTISPKIKAIVEAQLAGRTSGPVFRDSGGSAMTYDRWREIFMEVLDALQLPTRNHPAEDGRVLSPHCCRHTARSLMDHAAGTELAKMEIIGHASEEMGKRYTHQELKHLREVTDTM